MSYVLFKNIITVREKVNIDLEDRGYNFGDGIYEVIPVYDGKLFTLDEHLKRFEESAKKLEIQLPYDPSHLKQLIIELKDKNNSKNGLVYVQMTRGNAPRNHLFERNAVGLVTGFCQEIDFPVKEKQNGVAVYVTDDIRWLRCDIKTINLLGNTLAKRKATDYDCYEAILHRNGMVTEGSSSNLMMIKDGAIYTHPATNLILNGITRQLVIDLAKNAHIPVIEKPFTIAELESADEVFMTNSTHEVCPIISMKGDLNATFSIGKITRELQQLYTLNVLEQIKA